MKRYIPLAINVLIVLLFLGLPYYIFQGKLFVGGDDTRLQYVFPWEYFQHLSFFSWNNISSVSYYVPNYFSIPQTLLWTFLENIFKSNVIIDYLAFSAPIALGYIFMQFLLGELFEEMGFREKFIAALFYTLSPIMVQMQISVSLGSVWLIGLVPILLYFFLKYLKTGNIVYISVASLFSLILSIGFYAIPWFFGLLMPIILGFTLSFFFYSRLQVYSFIKKGVVFIGFILATQLFWIIPFFSTFLGSGNNLGSKVLTTQVGNTFRPTVLSTAIGNVFYPLANLFHRQIIEVFDWQTKGLFENFYDKITIFNTLYIFILVTPFFFFRNKVNLSIKKLYLLFFCSFLLSLYCFTVNLGPFREVFLLGGYIPGFVMFRNFYDKFAFGYVFLYAITIGTGYYILQRQFPRLKNILFIALTALILINAIPIKTVVNSPLWTTKNVYRTITFPQEYLEFLRNVKDTVSPSTNMLSLPLNIAAYTVVKEDGTNNVYAGTSPVKILSGINDYSGDLSFSPEEAGNIDVLLKNRQYDKLNQLLQQYNTSYIFVTKNIPDEVKGSYLFASGLKLKDQDSQFISAVVGKKVLTSNKGNYELYKAKYPTGIFELDKGQIVFEKVSPVHYVMQLKHVSTQATLLFRDSFHKGWKMFLSNKTVSCKNRGYVYSGSDQECVGNDELFNPTDLTFLWKKPTQVKQIPVENFGQKWVFNTHTLLQDTSLVTKNDDGTVNFTVELYFQPQLYFYVGSLLSIFTFIILILLSTRELMKR